MMNSLSLFYFIPFRFILNHFTSQRSFKLIALFQICWFICFVWFFVELVNWLALIWDWMRWLRCGSSAVRVRFGCWSSGNWWYSCYMFEVRCGSSAVLVRFWGRSSGTGVFGVDLWGSVQHQCGSRAVPETVFTGDWWMMWWCLDDQAVVVLGLLQLRCGFRAVSVQFQGSPSGASGQFQWHSNLNTNKLGL